LWESAKVIARNHSNQVPADLQLLRSLPGVGEYTATAILSFAFNQSHNVMDINIRRVFARAIDGVEHPSRSVTKREREERPVFGPTWSKAIMELGALVCTAKSPQCGICPISRSCLWLKNGSPKSSEVRKGQAWHGTKRQCRGMILKKLRDEGSFNRSVLEWGDSEMLELALEELVDEGFIAKRGDRYRLARA
jgi:A/G-specific adenine glycosylase